MNLKYVNGDIRFFSRNTYIPFRTKILIHFLKTTSKQIIKCLMLKEHSKFISQNKNKQALEKKLTSERALSIYYYELF